MPGGQTQVLAADAVRALRVQAQRLDAERPAADVAGVVRDVFALQAQDDAAATLGIWTRSDGLTLADVKRAREQERSVVRLWCLRGTLHLVAAEDVRWLLDLLRPTFATANRTRRAQLGLDDEATARGVAAVVQMLGTAGSCTRAEIAARLAELGIPSAGQATIHVIWRAALDGLVCYGPDRNGESTFVLLDDWVPAATKLGGGFGRAQLRHPTPQITGSRRDANWSDRDAALGELARRYLLAYGPAQPADLAAWSGLSLADARRAWSYLGDDAVLVQTEAGPMWQSSTRAPSHAAPVVRLLPAFDGLWLGYRDRDILLPPQYRARVYPGGGVIRPTILIGGQPVGTWTRRTRARSTDVVLNCFEDPSWPDTAQLVAGQLRRHLPGPNMLTAEQRTAGALEKFGAVATDLGRFLGQPVKLAS